MFLHSRVDTDGGSSERENASSSRTVEKDTDYLEEIEDLEDFALAQGITCFNSLTPKRLERIFKYRKEEKIASYNEQMAVAWEIGRLCAIGFNDPKKFPSKPYQYIEKKTSKLTREEQLVAWRAYIEANRAK